MKEDTTIAHMYTHTHIHMLPIRATAMAMASADKGRITLNKGKGNWEGKGKEAKAKGKGKRLSSALIWTHSCTCVCVGVYAKRLQNISIESHDYLHATRGLASSLVMCGKWEIEFHAERKQTQSPARTHGTHGTPWQK